MAIQVMLNKQMGAIHRLSVIILKFQPVCEFIGCTLMYFIYFFLLLRNNQLQSLNYLKKVKILRCWKEAIVLHLDCHSTNYIFFFLYCSFPRGKSLRWVTVVLNLTLACMYYVNMYPLYLRFCHQGSLSRVLSFKQNRQFSFPNYKSYVRPIQSPTSSEYGSIVSSFSYRWELLFVPDY